MNYSPKPASAHIASVSASPVLIPTDAPPIVRNSKRSASARATTLHRKAIRGIKYGGK